MQILIIDDDETFCWLLVEILEEMEIPTKWTRSGVTGYAMLAHDKFDLCIIDVRMPLVLGTELAEAIIEDYPSTKIILASAFADQALQEYARRLGVVLLSKPFSPSHLLDTVQRALGESSGGN